MLRVAANRRAERPVFTRSAAKQRTSKWIASIQVLQKIQEKFSWCRNFSASAPVQSCTDVKQSVSFLHLK